MFTQEITDTFVIRRAVKKIMTVLMHVITMRDNIMLKQFTVTIMKIQKQRNVMRNSIANSILSSTTGEPTAKARIQSVAKTLIGQHNAEYTKRIVHFVGK